MYKHKTTNQPLALIDGADELIRGFKTPDQFFTFLIDALSWVHEYELKNPSYENAKDAHFTLIMLLEHVYPKWKFGKKANEEIAKGLAVIADMYGDGFEEKAAGVMSAYAYEITTVGRPPQERAMLYLDGLKALSDLGYYLEDYWQQHLAEVKQKAA